VQEVYREHGKLDCICTAICDHSDLPSVLLDGHSQDISLAALELPEKIGGGKPIIL